MAGSDKALGEWLLKRLGDLLVFATGTAWVVGAAVEGFFVGVFVYTTISKTFADPWFWLWPLFAAIATFLVMLAGVIVMFYRMSHSTES